MLYLIQKWVLFPEAQVALGMQAGEGKPVQKGAGGGLEATVMRISHRGPFTRRFLRADGVLSSPTKPRKDPPTKRECEIQEQARRASGTCEVVSSWGEQSLGRHGSRSRGHL